MPDPPPPRPAERGPQLIDGGARFSLESAHASAVDLCLLDPHQPGREERVPLTHVDAGLWQVEVRGVRAGAEYGFRVHGERAPWRGHRFDPERLLVDPRARATTGPHRWHPSLVHGPFDPGAAPRSVLVDEAFDWAGDAAPRTGWAETVLYEVHVRGMTMQHPGVPPTLRGRYLGLCSDPILQHLQDLGVTAVQLLPVHQGVDEEHLVRRGLSNYWGYAPLAWFAPDSRFASGSRGEQVREFKEMVRRFHAAGIEVLLDVVFNHTGEGDRQGPTLSLRGTDNATWFRLHPTDPSRDLDWTGCGNTLDFGQPAVRRLVHDALRYWAEEMHVDGFRFDLAAVLGRQEELFEPDCAFFERLRRDPALARVKLIAEPWDLGPRGYQPGRFPEPFAEWNDRFRDDVRRYWRGDPGLRGALATRLAGSSDVRPDRGPTAGVNFVACHDGFTLRDVVTFSAKRNEANGESGRDGSDANHSCSWGVEGPTDDTGVLALRDRVARSLIGSVLVAQGVPMIAHGDELGRSQGGNNNAYCQDNPTSWLRWDLSPRDEAMRDFVRRALALRRAQPGLRRSRFLRGGTKGADVLWLDSRGEVLDDDAWGRRDDPFLAMLLDPEGTTPVLILLNGGPAAAPLQLPPGPWSTALDSADDGASAGDPLPPRTLRVLVRG